MTLIAAKDAKKPDTVDPEVGDLVWGQQEYEKPRVFLRLDSDEYVDDEGFTYPSNEITVLSIIGPCVFAVEE